MTYEEAIAYLSEEAENTKIRADQFRRAGYDNRVGRDRVEKLLECVEVFRHAVDYPDYDAGLLNDFGGGDVGWWQDYLRAEIGRANDYWRGIYNQHK